MTEGTEAPTARKLEKAREEGQVPISREATLLAGLLAGGAALAAQIAANREAVPHWLIQRLTQTSIDGAFAGAAASIISAALPATIAAAAGVAAAVLLQTGFLFRPHALTLEPGRLSPARGLKRIFSVETAMSTARALVKLGVLGFLMWREMHRLLPGLMAAPLWLPTTLRDRMLGEATRLFVVLAGTQAIIAVFDLFWVRFQHARKQRMTKQEIQDEHRDSEGNPLVKQRLRQIIRARAKRRMMAAIPRASVIITNPTHYAIALAYKSGSRGAPRVVAKGVDDIAERIRSAARDHRVPIVANPPLARALFRIEIDAEIPTEHFKAVAEIIAYVWRMRARAARL